MPIILCYALCVLSSLISAWIFYMIGRISLAHREGMDKPETKRDKMNENGANIWKSLNAPPERREVVIVIRDPDPHNAGCVLLESWLRFDLDSFKKMNGAHVMYEVLSRAEAIDTEREKRENNGQT